MAGQPDAMPSLAQQICLNHSAREAVAQCPECRHFFCRECIVEHDDRILCGSCLRKLTAPQKAGRRRWRTLAGAGLGLAGLLTAVLYFYWFGQLLLLIPTPFHDGTLWKSYGGGQ
jgi:hypothetical protein